MARASLHNFYVTTAKFIIPEFFYVNGEPIHYTDKVGRPSVIPDAQWIT